MNGTSPTAAPGACISRPSSAATTREDTVRWRISASRRINRLITGENVMLCATMYQRRSRLTVIIDLFFKHPEHCRRCYAYERRQYALPRVATEPRPANPAIPPSLRELWCGDRRWRWDRAKHLPAPAAEDSFPLLRPRVPGSIRTIPHPPGGNLMEACNHCGRIHYITTYPAVAVAGLYFCKMSCRNAYFGARQTGKLPTFAHFEHG